MDLIVQIEKNIDSQHCIFCLSDSPLTIEYVGLCDCHPKIHKECILKWSKTKPNTCPICLKQTIKSETEVVVSENLGSRCGCLFSFCCLCLCCGPFILLSVLGILGVIPGMPTKSYNTTVH